MIKEVEIKLDNGSSEFVVFNNYAMKLLSREIISGQAASVEDTAQKVFECVSAWGTLSEVESTSFRVYSDLDNICKELAPVLKCAMNAYNELHKKEEDVTLKDAERVLNHIEMDSLVLFVSSLAGSVFPTGLPVDKKKEVEAESV